MPALAVCVEAAVTPPAYGLPWDGPLPSAVVDGSSSHWSTSLSSSLYKVDGWGAPYFAVNSSGNISVRPHGLSTLSHQEIDLLKIVKKVSDPKSTGGLGLPLPLIVRLPDVLKNRLESLQSAFEFAVQTHNYGGHYQGVYPVKCNQDRYVVEDIVRFGSGFRFGLEAGSKPELLLAMSCLCKASPEALLVCNGFKDAEYISLALVARKLSLNTIIVLEQEEELDLVINISKKLRVRPVIGVRAKLRTKHSGHFGSTSGEKGKFGLGTIQILRVVKRLKEAGMLDCFQFLHFHIGSQIPTTTLLADGVSEAAQIYCELVRLGANMRVIDIGGGLGIDYDGSKSSDSDISVSYSLEEYASAVVQAIRYVCDRKNVRHPVLCSESGRAIVSHHSVLIFEAVSMSVPGGPTMSHLGLQYLVEALTEEARGDYVNLMAAVVEALTEEARGDYVNLMAAVVRGESENCLFYADKLKQRCVDMFKEGCLGIEQLAAVDGLCEWVGRVIGLDDPVRTYHVNLSVFTSIPDFWGIGQLFPIIPIHRLDERPGVRGVLSDLTCDSDGKIDRFIGGDTSLPLHDLGGGGGEEGGGGGVGSGGGKYYLGMFLGGAYEEALGGVHNLFGGPSVVRVSQSDGPHSFAVTRATPGPSCADVLRVMQHEPALMFETLKHRIEEYCCGGHDDHGGSGGDTDDDDHNMGGTNNNNNDDNNSALASSLVRSFHNMPYLVVPSSCSLTAINNGGGFYYCNEDDYNAVVESASAEDDQWSYCVA